jgi:flagellar motor switch protein FliN/FliY
MFAFWGGYRVYSFQEYEWILESSGLNEESMTDVLSREERDALRRGAAKTGPGSRFGGETGPGEGQTAQGLHAVKVNGGKAKRPRGKIRNVRLVSEDVVIAPAAFQPVAADEEPADKTHIDLILDTELEITAELGSAIKTVREILEYGPGSVIELNKLSGEPVDLFVNKRRFSRGEVLVIDENFGIRVTDIVSVEERIEALGSS